MQVNPEDCPPEIYVTWSDPRMTDFENILRYDTWEINSVFIVDLNATIRRGFTNPTADYQKAWLEIDVGVDRQYKMWHRNISILYFFFAYE